MSSVFEKVLVTGATGNVGGATMTALAKERLLGLFGEKQHADFVGLITGDEQHPALIRRGWTGGWSFVVGDRRKRSVVSLLPRFGDGLYRYVDEFVDEFSGETVDV